MLLPFGYVDNMGWAEGLLIGVMGGIVTALLILLSSVFWKKIILPWFENQIYKDANIEGRWEGRVPKLDTPGTNPTKYKEIIVVKREGHQVNGTITCVSGVDEHRTYKFCGSFKNLIMAAIYDTDETDKIDRGAFVVKLSDNGNTFKGHCLFYYPNTESINCSDYEWSKVT